MTAMLARDEWKALSDFLALGAAALCVIIGLVLAVAGEDRVIAFHGCVLLAAAALAFLFMLTKIIDGRAPDEGTGYADGVVRAIRSVSNPDKLGHLGPVSDLARLPES